MLGSAAALMGNVWTGGCSGGWVLRRADGKLDGCMFGWTDEYSDGWVGRRVLGRLDARMGGCSDRLLG